MLYLSFLWLLGIALLKKRTKTFGIHQRSKVKLYCNRNKRQMDLMNTGMRRVRKSVDGALLKGDIKGGGILAGGRQGISKQQRHLIRSQRHSGRGFTKLIGRRTLKSGQVRADTEG